LDFGDLRATDSKNSYDIRNVLSILYNLEFVLEFSKDFGKSRKPWWGRHGREGGLGGWWVILSTRDHILFPFALLPCPRHSVQQKTISGNEINFRFWTSGRSN
jgi:hypothetical protein